MKTRTLVLRAMLFLGLTPLYFMKLHAQQQPAPEKNVTRLKIVQEKNGKRMVIDTVIENNPNFDADAFLLSKGLDIPEKPGKPVMVRRGMKCDSSFLNAMERNEIGPVFFNLEAPPAPPEPPTPPAPGDPVTPPALPQLPDDVLKKIAGLNLDISTMGDTIIIISNENENIGSNGSTTRTSKQTEIYVFRNVQLACLDKAEQKDRKAPDQKDELHIERLHFFPNPNNGLFKLEFELSEKGNTTISIAEKNGNEVYTEKLNGFTGRYEKEIDLTKQPKGLYYLTVKQGKQSLVRKLLIE